MTINEMKETALNKVFEAYQAIGLMSSRDRLRLEIKAEKQAIKEWREGLLQ